MVDNNALKRQPRQSAARHHLFQQPERRKAASGKCDDLGTLKQARVELGKHFDPADFMNVVEET